MKLNPCLVKVSCYLPLNENYRTKSTELFIREHFYLQLQFFLEMKVVLIWMNFCQIFLPWISLTRYGFLHVVKLGNEDEGNVYTGTEGLRTGRIMYWDYACSCFGIKCV
jgi:hypothetical protein